MIGSGSGSGSGRAVAFVDDSPEQIDAVRATCPGVKLYKVPHKTRKARRLAVPLKYGRIREQPVIDIGVGINKQTVAALLHDLKKGDTALFDWGRTLTQVKSVSFVDIDPADDEAVLRWAVGGRARLGLLRRLFSGLRRHGVRIGMLSNSGNCGQVVWKRLVERLVGSDDVFYMCGKGDKGQRLSRKRPRLCL